MLKKRFCLIFSVREKHVSALQFELGREGQGLEGVEAQGERGSSSWSCADAQRLEMSERSEKAWTLAKPGTESCEFARYLFGKIWRACVQGTGKGGLCGSMLQDAAGFPWSGESVGRAGKGRMQGTWMGNVMPRTGGREMYVAHAMGRFALHSK